MQNRLKTPLLFTLLGYNINAMIDKGDFVERDKIHKMAEEGTLINWLEENCSTLSLWSDEEKKIMSVEFDSMSNVSDDSKYYDVHNNGLCLLVAFCFEFINHPPTSTLEDL